jgi:hypothetical protein
VLVSRSNSELSRDAEAILADANPDRLANLAARVNNALPDDDARKIRRGDVTQLRRLASQAREFSESLEAHAAERRSVGEGLVQVSPESGETARWADRLAFALESIVRGSATPTDGHGP